MALVRAKSFTFTRITSMPRSSEAFNSNVFCRQPSLNNSLAITKERVVLPIPAGPENNR